MGKYVVNGFFSMAKNRLMTRLTRDGGLRLRRVEQEAGFEVTILETPSARMVDSH
jgi:hypothetical protein